MVVSSCVTSSNIFPTYCLCLIWPLPPVQDQASICPSNPVQVVLSAPIRGGSERRVAQHQALERLEGRRKKKSALRHFSDPERLTTRRHLKAPELGQEDQRGRKENQRQILIQINLHRRVYFLGRRQFNRCRSRSTDTSTTSASKQVSAESLSLDNKINKESTRRLRFIGTKSD